jgi:hypothetical protein
MFKAEEHHVLQVYGIVKLRFFCSMYLCFPWFCACLYWSHHTSHKNSVISSWNICLCFVLPYPSFLGNTFQLSINWPVAVILSAFNWKLREKKILSYNFLCPLRCVYIVSRLCQRSRAMFQYWRQASAVTPDFWCALSRDCKFHVLIKLLH